MGQHETESIPNRSCIPYGIYRLCKRCSKKFGWHLLVQNVPGRSMILIHPANNAIKELRGCIAPVTTLTAPGEGEASRAAMQLVMQCVAAALEAKQTLFLIIGPGPALCREGAGFNNTYL